MCRSRRSRTGIGAPNVPNGAPNPIPLRLATDAEFAALRSALAAAEYTEPAICARLGIQKISKFQFVTERRPVRRLAENPDELELLIHLFLENDPIEHKLAQALP